MPLVCILGEVNIVSVSYFEIYWPLKLEPPDSLPNPVNKDTPILHMNGNLDVLVPPAAGQASATAMRQVFTNYQQMNVMGNHLTIVINPLNPIVGSRKCTQHGFQYTEPPEMVALLLNRK